MSSDATDPVKALQEWCAECDGARSGILGDLHRVEERNRAAGCGGYGDVVAKARAALSAAPALLARIEAGEGLLAAMQARAEKAEESLERAEGDHRFVLTETVAAYEAKIAALESRLAEQNRIHVEAIRGCNDGAVILAAERRQAEEQAELERARADRAESRLAEVAPVVEAAIWQSHISNLVTATGYKSLHKVDCEPNAAKWMDATTDTELAVTAMLAARLLRGAGEGSAEAWKGEEAK